MAASIDPSSTALRMLIANDASTGSPRSSRACTECHRKKARCDRLLPGCMKCFKAGDACIYPTSRRKKSRSTTTKSSNSWLEQIGSDGTSLQQQDLGMDGTRQAVSEEYGDLFDYSALLSPTTRLRSDISPHDNLAGWTPEFLLDASEDMALDSADNCEVSAPSIYQTMDVSSSLMPSLPANIPALASKTVEKRTDSPKNVMLSITRDLPEQVSNELIALFFVKVHCFVPILNQPDFLQKYLSRDRNEPLNIESSLILYSMFALAARFSNSSYFGDLKQSERGVKFAEQAHKLYAESVRVVTTPSLAYLQGCTLLAYHAYLAGPDSPAWLLVGTCSRLAYDLGLHRVDVEASDPATWKSQEERRRLWWSIWELDTFASAISCRPHTIDQSNINVKLPVSDDAWYQGKVIESVVVDNDPVHAWHCLRNCPNQNVRAWFLVANSLLLAAYNLYQHQDRNREKLEKLDKAISCFGLLLPSQFHMDSDIDNLIFDTKDFAQCNWIISTNIMLLGCKIFVQLARSDDTDNGMWYQSHGLFAQIPTSGSLNIRTENYRGYVEQIIRIIKRWSPIYIPHTSPFIGTLILGPAGINIRVARDSGKRGKDGRFVPSVDAEILKLTLSHFARFWKLGEKLLDLANLLSNPACELPQSDENVPTSQKDHPVSSQAGSGNCATSSS